MEYSSLLKDFLDDASGLLKVFDSALLSLETKGFDRDIIVNTLGALHTLKGNSGMMGFESLKVYIHHVEEILKKVEDNGLELGKVMEVLLDSANVLRNVLQGLGKDPAFNADLMDEIVLLQGHLMGEGSRVKGRRLILRLTSGQEPTPSRWISRGLTTSSIKRENSLSARQGSIVWRRR